MSSPSHCLTWIGGKNCGWFFKKQWLAAILSNLSGNERFAATVDNEGKIKIPDRVGDGFLYADPKTCI